MAKRSRLFLSFIALVLVISYGLKDSASALSGISLSPFEQQLTIQPTDVSKSFNLTITNHTAILQELDLSTKDFGSLNDTGGVLLEGDNSYTERYGLASWLTLGTDTVILNPNQSSVVPITINNRTDLASGGHYAAVIASVNSTLNNQSSSHVTVNQQLLSLVLVDKTGGEHFALNLNKVTPNGNWFHLPNTIELEFQNPGNVEVTPRGLVKLESPSGKVISQGIINPGSAFILPSSFYDIYVPLQSIGGALPLPGFYKIVVNYRYDQITNYATKTVITHFISLGMYLLFIVLIIIALIIVKKRKNLTTKKAKKTD